VSWNDVQGFLKKLNEREKGKGWLYRLPTEAEWEYACRGAATSKEQCSFDFYLDKPTNELSPKFANFGNKNVTVKVGSYPPNKLGLYDMHGNVQQWCEDLWNPKIPTVTARVTRGGNWAWSEKGCRAATRATHPPSRAFNYVGFRVARVASDSK
jgi:formylglycine-generating enzyme required for sulfatase activity